MRALKISLLATAISHRHPAFCSLAWMSNSKITLGASLAARAQ